MPARGDRGRADKRCMFKTKTFWLWTAAVAVVAMGFTAALGGVRSGGRSDATTVMPVEVMVSQQQVVALLDEVENWSSRYTGDHYALPHSVADLYEYGVRLGDGDAVKITWKTGFGYCLNVWNPRAPMSNSQATALRFDSVTGEHLRPGERPNPKGVCTLA